LFGGARILENSSLDPGPVDVRSSIPKRESLFEPDLEPETSSRLITVSKSNKSLSSVIFFHETATDLGATERPSSWSRKT
jgi:hypothetical protein